MSQTSNPVNTRDAAWLARYYAVRAAFSLAWVSVAFSLGNVLTPLGAVLLVAYPAWDALANLYDAKRNGGPQGQRHSGVQRRGEYDRSGRGNCDPQLQHPCRPHCFRSLGSALGHPPAGYRRPAVARVQRAVADDPERSAVGIRRYPLHPEGSRGRDAGQRGCRTVRRLRRALLRDLGNRPHGGVPSPFGARGLALQSRT